MTGRLLVVRSGGVLGGFARGKADRAKIIKKEIYAD
jgi:hypothetical protein